eukprot:jgi/Phyca11/576909/estExt2_Genewise1.C_PHYCAscaffold_980049
MEVTRGRISSCSIFREMPAGLGSRDSKVDVYVKGYVEAHGKLLDSVALTAASTGFMSSWNSVECANLKKLMWCFRQQPDCGRGGRRSRVSGKLLNKRCATCDKSVAKIWKSRAVRKVCDLCKAPLCSNCCVKKDLYEISPQFRARKSSARTCPQCWQFVKQLDAKEVQRQEMLRPQRPEVFNPLTPQTLDTLARNFSLENSFCTASVESLCYLDSPRARSDSVMTDLLN